MTSSALAYVDGQIISARDRTDLLRHVESSIDAGSGFTLYTLNMDHLVKRRQSAAFRALYARATFVTADGWPVVTLARRQDRAMERTAGADLVIPLCRLAARRALPVHFYGSRAEILEAAASKLAELCPGLEIAGREAPPFGFDPLSEAGRDATFRIAASGARLCFVALGAPKQEIFSDFARDIAPKVGFVCIGAGLDFIAGAQTRAPSALQRLRLEWAWRLASQPRRLGMRYIRCGLLFARLVFRPAV